MANDIKGITVEIGGDTTNLKKALEDVNKSAAATTKELTQIILLTIKDLFNVYAAKARE